MNKPNYNTHYTVNPRKNFIRMSDIRSVAFLFFDSMSKNKKTHQKRSLPRERFLLFFCVLKPRDASFKELEFVARYLIMADDGELFFYKL